MKALQNPDKKTIQKNKMIHFPESELILNADGSIFHLHLFPDQIADNVLLVGDPGRVDLIASKLSDIEFNVSNREFVSTTGSFNGKRISVIGTGIGADNIDIVLNELDALVNIDFDQRTLKPERRTLNIIRIGTCGGLQPELIPGTFLISAYSIGLDSVLHYYANRADVCDLELEKAFTSALNWPVECTRPYAIQSNQALVEQIGEGIHKGITITANGFYGPQGRALRLPLSMPNLNDQMTDFIYQNLKITNYEMESSAVAGLSALMGHRATTICLVIANRKVKNVDVDYKERMDALINLILKRL